MDASIDTRFGTFAVTPSDIVEMVQPIAGFETCRRYVLLAAAVFEPFSCLQGLDEPRPSFLTVPPQLVAPQYTTALDPSARTQIDLRDDDTLLWLALVRIDEDRAFANLRAPVVINPRRMLGLQVLSSDERDAIDHPLPLD
jgi:flagellar assembly factor FliW